MNAGHSWTETDDLAALYLFRCPTGQWTLADVSRALGIDDRAMRMRVSNHRAIETGKGLRNASKQTQRVHRSFASLSCSQLETELRKRIRTLGVGSRVQTGVQDER